ncbi:MAG TPA: sugar ABC transporter substrate-binding protein [Chloroflexota bacterium]|nr:sugar ABC transporter substrate-binding protein [Chloroflexota bacterium]
MNTRQRRSRLGIVTSVSLLAALLAGGSSAGLTARAAGTTRTATFPWGTFTLNARIAAKVAAKQPLNAIVSFQALGVPFAVPEMNAGMRRAAAALKMKYGVTVNSKVVGPVNTDPNAQISQVTTLINSGQVDCLAIEPVTPDAFASIFDVAFKAGVPIFAVNTDAPKAHRFSYYGIDELAGGKVVGKYTVIWLNQHHIKPTGAAIFTGDTTAPWAQGRMTGWLDMIKAAYPGLTIYGTPTSAPSDNYQGTVTYSKVKSLLTGHPNVNLIFHTDWGIQYMPQAISDLQRAGKVTAVGYNVDDPILNEVQSGQIIGTLDQRYDNQSAGFVQGCGDFLLGGKKPSYPVTYVSPFMVTQANVVAYRKLFHQMINSK